LIVSVKSTAEIELIGGGTGAALLTGNFAATALALGAVWGAASLAASGFAALLEMTNRRRAGGVLAVTALGAVAWALCGADWGAVT
jgi:hypothetical protein